MLEDASNEALLAGWLAGNQGAATTLVQRYMVRLTALVRGRLSRKLARRVDPEDIVLSAWRSFFVAAGDHRLTVPGDDELWPLLVTFTLRKLARQSARHTAQRRGIDVECNLDAESDWRMILSRDPSPEEATLLADEIESLMAALDTADREVLTRRLQGEDRNSIASHMQCSERTIRRSLERIRSALIAQAGHDSSSRLGDAGYSESDSSRQSHEVKTPAPLPWTFPTPTIQHSDILLNEMVGEGGFGKVYRARWKPSETVVAVKYLKKRFWKDLRAAEALVRETITVAALSHKNIIQHHGWGRSPNGAVFVVMAWIDGVDAGVWAKQSKPSIDAIIECGIAISSAVSTANNAGVIHGDLTPRNVLFGRDGDFILTDFGFSRSLNDTTRPFVGGTPGFLAPEQVSDAFGPVSSRTDVYGLGALLYALVAKRPPMLGDDLPEILANVLSSRLPEPLQNLVPNLPTAFNSIVRQCLMKEPFERPVSAQDVGQRLQTALYELKLSQKTVRTRKPEER